MAMSDAELTAAHDAAARLGTFLGFAHALSARWYMQLREGRAPVAVLSAVSARGGSLFVVPVRSPRLTPQSSARHLTLLHARPHRLAAPRRRWSLHTRRRACTACTLRATTPASPRSPCAARAAAPTRTTSSSSSRTRRGRSRTRRTATGLAATNTTMARASGRAARAAETRPARPRPATSLTAQRWVVHRAKRLTTARLPDDVLDDIPSDALPGPLGNELCEALMVAARASHQPHGM